MCSASLWCWNDTACPLGACVGPPKTSYLVEYNCRRGRHLCWQVKAQPTALLNNGEHIPLFGLGTFKTDAQTAKDAIVAALAAGVRMVDCASHYGQEPAIGNGLHAAFKQGVARREDIFIASKLWCVPSQPSDASPDDR